MQMVYLNINEQYLRSRDKTDLKKKQKKKQKADV